MIVPLSMLFLLAVGASTFAAEQKDAPIPAIFSRTQLKYGLERDNYLSRWVDRPLLLDPRLQSEGERADINEASIRLMKTAAMDYGLSGFAFFPEISRTRQIYDIVNENRPDGFHLLSEFGSKGKEKDQLAIAKIALESPASFRLDGKVVFTSYGADRLPPKHWSSLMEKIRAAHGDHFIFLPAIVRFAGEPSAYWNQRFHEGKITEADEERVKASLREWVRHTDGLYFASTAGIKRKRQFDGAFYREFIIRLMRETLDEPEFKGKYFGLSANLGHENCTRFGFTQNSGGTQTLRQSLEAAIAAKPHLINIPEWDEQNENTSLRPTVYSGYSSKRILRHYTHALKGQLQPPLPHDDLEQPNLIVSYRKCIVAGEKLEIELLNIPDAASQGGYEVQLTLSNVEGKEVYASEKITFSAASLNEHRIALPSEQFAGARLLTPTLTITQSDKSQTISTGLQPIDLRSSENWDYKWVKQPIRDLLQPEEFAFTVDEPDAAGLRKAHVRISSPEPLRFVEVLDNDDVIYSHSLNTEIWRENESEVVISLNWQAAKIMAVKGQIELINGGNAKWKVPAELPASAVQGNTLHLDRVRVNHWPRRILVSIPKSAVADAAFELETSLGERQTIPVKRLLEIPAYGVASSNSFNLVLSRYIRQDVIPVPLSQRKVQFSTLVLPDRSDSVLLVQAHGISGRLYRSRPVIAGASAASGKAVVWSEVNGHPARIEAPVQTIDYQFTPEHGSILTTNAGRPFFGILGGYAQQATERGGGESLDGTPFIRGSDYPAKAVQSAPAWAQTDEGRHVLRFDGKGTYITLPQGSVPRLSGFTVEMEIRPEHIKGRQILLANRSYYPGSISLLIDNGILKARYAGENQAMPMLNSKLRIKPEEWNRIRVFYDQSHLWFEVNGETSERLPASGPGMYDTVTSIGGFGTEWFAGDLASLRIHHTPFLP